MLNPRMQSTMPAKLVERCIHCSKFKIANTVFLRLLKAFLLQYLNFAFQRNQNSGKRIFLTKTVPMTAPSSFRAHLFQYFSSQSPMINWGLILVSLAILSKVLCSQLWVPFQFHQWGNFHCCPSLISCVIITTKRLLWRQKFIPLDSKCL